MEFLNANNCGCLFFETSAVYGLRPVIYFKRNLLCELNFYFEYLLAPILFASFSSRPLKVILGIYLREKKWKIESKRLQRWRKNVCCWGEENVRILNNDLQSEIKFVASSSMYNVRVVCPLLAAEYEVCRWALRFLFFCRASSISTTHGRSGPEISRRQKNNAYVCWGTSSRCSFKFAKIIASSSVYQFFK